MKKRYQLLSLTLLIPVLVACANMSTKEAEKAPSLSTQKKDTDTGKTTSLKYPPMQSNQLDKTTFLFNGAENDLSVMKTIERYVHLTSNYDFANFDQTEADKRLAELKNLKLNMELAPDEQEMFQTIVEKAKSVGSGTSKVTQLGIFKEKNSEKDPEGTYDDSYQVALTMRIEEDERVVSETTMVALVWMKADKIQASFSVADLQEVVDVADFFNNLN